MIPCWNMAGVLPAIRPGKEGNDSDRSPYAVTLKQVVERFASTPDRIIILKGLFDYRKALHDLGITQGFQWLDGSFMEEIEAIESRSPRDLDVVTFLNIPDGKSEKILLETNPDLFNHGLVKTHYKLDTYMHVLGNPLDAIQVKLVSYWYSMWSHRRDGTTWKGFIQIELSPTEDALALDTLVLLEGGITS